MKTVVDYLSELIRIPSVSAVSNRPIIDYAAMVLHTAGWSVRELAYQDRSGEEKINLIAAPRGEDIDDPQADLTFVCHTDTVPYAADWDDALEPVLRDGMIHGCGACDVKGFLACLLTAISSIAHSKLTRGLRVALTADEEIGCVGASGLVASNHLQSRRMVIGEPTSLHPARAGKGYCLAEVTVLGKEAHSAHPQEGISAIYEAAHLITAIEKFGDDFRHSTHGFFSPEFTTLNVGTIHGGTAKNIIPGSCRFQLEWRPIPGQALDAVPRAIAEIMARLKDVNPAFHAEIKILRSQSGFETRADSPLVRSLETLAGHQSISIPFGSEASVFAPLAEEVVVFGPGDMRTAHSNRERVPIAELNRAVACLSALMCRA